MDRKAWFAVILSVIGLAGWYWYVSTNYHPAPPSAAVASATPAQAVASASPIVSANVSANPAQSVEASIAPETSSLSTSSSEYFFRNDAGGIEKILLYLHKGDLDKDVVLNQAGALPIGTLELGDNQLLNGFSMVTNPSKGEVIFQKTTTDGIEITKRFVLPDGGNASGQYLVNLELSFKNTGASDVVFPSSFISVGRSSLIHTSDLPLYTRFDWLRGTSMTDINVTWFKAGAIPLIGYQTSPEKALYTATAEKISWAAVSSQYFCTIINAPDSIGSSVWARRFLVNPDNKNVYGIEGALGFPEFRIPAGQTVVRNLTIYAGPKDYEILHKLGNDQEAIMKFGWFKYVSIFLLWAMNSLYGVLGSYALAIIVLTLCIKSVLWYPQNKATASMKRMSALSPKMTELREKYKDDPTKMNEELMKLYKEYNVNPLGGCLPMLIQIPIFFGFYAMLGTAIELRNSSFLWVHDLSQPDTVGHIMGYPINVLPLIMAGTMLWQMSLTPKSGDATQQRFMLFMPMIFVVFCYNYASALALYWTTQNLFSIVQLYLTRNNTAPKLEKKSDVARRLALEEKKKRKRRP